jgi:hypothetical protein
MESRNHASVAEGSHLTGPALSSVKYTTLLALMYARAPVIRQPRLSGVRSFETQIRTHGLEISEGTYCCGVGVFVPQYSALLAVKNPLKYRYRGISPGFINIQVRCALSHCSKILNSNERSFVRSRTVLTLGRTVGEQNLKGISIQGCTVPPYTTDHVH